MKVFFILDNAFPSNNPSAKRVKCYCKGLNYHGVDTEILTISQKGNPEDSEGLAYKMIGIGHDGSLPSKFNAFIHNLRELKKYISRNAGTNDIIYLYSDGLLIGALPLILGTDRKYVRELCEIPYYFDSWKARIFRWLYFHTFFKLYDGVVAISKALEDLAYKYKSSNCYVIKIPILVDVNKYLSIDSNEKSEELMVFHSGSHDEEKDGFYGMLKTIGILKNKYNINLHLYCTRFEPTSKEYNAIIMQHNIQKNIHFLGYLSDKELLEWQQRSSFFIINKYNSFQNRYCFATKLGEYLASGKLVVLTRVGEAINYLKDSKTCIFVEPGSSEIMAAKIADIINNLNSYDSIGKEGRKLTLEQFNCYNVTDKLKSFLLNIN